MGSDYTTIHPFFRTGRQEVQFKTFKRSLQESLEDVRQQAKAWTDENKGKVDILNHAWSYKGSTDPEKKGPSSYDHVLTISYIDLEAAASADSEGGDEEEDDDPDPDDPDTPGTDPPKEPEEPEEPKPGEKTENSKADVDGYYYDTITEAFKNLQAGQTLTLTEDTDSSADLWMKNGTTLDLAGKSLSLNPDCMIGIMGSDVTIKGGTIKQSGGSGSYSAVQVGASNAAGTATLDGVEVSGDTGIIVMGKGSSVTVKGTTKISGTHFGIATNGSDSGTTINIDGGEITGPDKSCGIYLPSGTMKVSGGNITGGSGIVVRGGNLTVTGGTIKGTADSDVEVGDVQYTIPAAGINIDKHTSYTGGNVNVNISAGNISGTKNAVVYTDKGQPTETGRSNTPGVTISGGNFTGTVLGE